MPAIRPILRSAGTLLALGILWTAGAPTLRAEEPPVATPSPVLGPRTDPAAIPHTNVVALPLIANMTNLPPQLVEAAAVYADQPQYTPGAGVARTITPYSVGITLLPAGSPPAAQAGTLASPQVDVVVRPVVIAPRTATVAAMSAAMIASSPSLMPGAASTELVVMALPAPVVPPNVVAKTDAPIVAPQVGAGTPLLETQLPLVTVGVPAAAGSPVLPAPVVVAKSGTLPAQRLTDHATHLERLVATPAAPLIGSGAEGVVCNSFDTGGAWASVQSRTDVWSDWYGGWAPFAVDDGFRQARNTTFSMERVIGPGRHYGTGYAAKIASNQPYAGGFGSPILHVTPGARVTVRVKYLLWDYIQNPEDAQRVRDWASMGIKPDAHGNDAIYVNGYVRGQWDQMTNSVTAGASGQIMVLLQGESAAAVNSNIYFDDVQIFVDGVAMERCVYE